MSDLKKSQADQGLWNEVGKSGVVGTHASLLHTRQVLFFTRPEEISHKWGTLDNGLDGDAARQPTDRDVTLSTIIDISGEKAFQPRAVHVEHNPFCAGHTFLPDGSVLVAGGDKKDTSFKGTPENTKYGLNSLRVFVPSTGEWKYIGEISDSRWYPTCTLLPNGQVFILSGNLDDMPTYNAQNPTCETIPPSPGGAQFLYFLLEAFPYHSYPFVFVLPSGELFVFSKDSSYFLDTERDKWGRKRWFVRNGPKLTDQQGAQKPAKHYPNSGTAVLLPLLPDDNNKYQAEVMIIGGSGADIYLQWADNPIPGFDCKTHEINAVNNCYRLVIDSQKPDAASWKETAPMKNPRVMPDAVLLPDGKVLVVNGASRGFAGGNAATGPMLPQYAVKEAEIYDPVKDEWQSLAEAQYPRLYHSTALLLPDARVMVAGSDHQYNAFIPIDLQGVEKNQAVAGGYEYRIEVFSPPYLSDAALRPIYELADAERCIFYGSSFEIKVNDLPKMDFDKLTACLIYPSSVTHNNNMSQRYVGLKISIKSETSISVETPADSNLAPPGYYMLFLVYNGVPSEAEFVQLRLEIPQKEKEVELSSNDLAVWFRADAGVIADANGSLYSWADISGNAMDVYWTPNTKRRESSPEPRQRPPRLIHNQLNGHSVVRFGLIQVYEGQWGGYLKSNKNFLPGAGAFTVFAVVHPLPSGQFGPGENGVDQDRGTPGLVCWGPMGTFESKRPFIGMRFGPGPRSSNPPDGIWINHLPKYPGKASVVTYLGETQVNDDTDAPISMAQAVLLETSFDGAQRCSLRLNGEKLAESDSVNIGNIGDGPLIIGRNGVYGDFLRGDVAEIIIYRRAIEDEERQKIQEYLQNRYSLW